MNTHGRRPFTVALFLKQKASIVSEVRELVEELKDRFTAWRLRSRSEQHSSAPYPADANADVPGIEFIPLDPFQTPKPGNPRAFTDMTPAWIAAQCPPHIFAHGQQLVTRKQVARAVAHGGRLTGTTRERHYEDQEIRLAGGSVTAACTCQKRENGLSAAITSPAAHPAHEATHVLPCRHVVAVLLTYLQTPASLAAPPKRSSSTADKLVCPVTRQTLKPGRTLLQCAQCGLYYSPEGWEFLRKEARGHCCNCNARNTVKEVIGG